MAVEYLLTKNPDGVESLILSGLLLNSSLWAKDQKEYIEKLPSKTCQAILEAEDREDYDSSEYEEAMMQFYKLHICRMETWPDCLKAFFDLNLKMYQYMWGPSEFTISGTLKNYDRVGNLSEINIPVLFTCGEYDEATPATTRFFQKHISGSKIHIFKEASHEHNLEKHDEYMSVIEEFIRQIEKRKM